MCTEGSSVWSTRTPEYGPQARQSRHIACAPTDYLVGYYLFAGFSGVLQRAKHEETECVRFSRICSHNMSIDCPDCFDPHAPAKHIYTTGDLISISLHGGRREK